MLAKLQTTVAQNAWVRAVVLFSLCVVVGLVLLPHEIRSALALKAVYYLGAPLIISIILGASIGWLAYSRKAFLWTTGTVLTLLFVVQVIRFGSEAVNSNSASCTVAEIKDSRRTAQSNAAPETQPQQQVQAAVEVKPPPSTQKTQAVAEVKPPPATPRDWKVCQRGDGEALLVKDIVAACTRIIESRSAPNPSLIYARRGSGYDDLHDSDRAMQDLNEAIRLDPTFAWAFYLRSGVREKVLGDIQGAYLDSVKASDLDISYLPRRNYLVRTYGIREVVTSEADWIKSQSK